MTTTTVDEAEANLGRHVFATVKATKDLGIARTKARLKKVSRWEPPLTRTTRDWMRAVICVGIFMALAGIASVLFAQAMIMFNALSPIAAFLAAVICLATCLFFVEASQMA